jgi:hypothetical protein
VRNLNLNLNLNLVIILILFFHGLFLSYFPIHPKASYSITFLLYFSIILFYLSSSLRINKWLFFAIIVLIPSVLVGLYLEWSYIDSAADIARYLAPFVGYSAGLIILKQMDYYKVLYALYLLLGIHLILFYYSVISKISHMFQGGPLVEYAGGYGLEVHSVYAFIVYFLLKNKLVFGIKKLLMIGYFIGFIANPILIMSKARLIAMLLSLALIFLLFSNFKDRVLMIVLALFVATTSYIYFEGRTYQQQPYETIFEQGKDTNVTVFSRFQDTLELIRTKRYHADASTSFRVAEIKNLTGMIYSEAPRSLFFGFGAGALYYDDYSEIKGGILQENYRSDGGVHDIFFMPLAYLFRYGFVGIFLILYFSLHVYRRLLTSYSNLHQDTIAKSLKLFILISFFADLFVGVHVYGNLSFGFLLAFGIIFQNKTNNPSVYKTY